MFFTEPIINPLGGVALFGQVLLAVLFKISGNNVFDRTSNGKTSLGTFLRQRQNSTFSIFLTVLRETPSRLAISLWERPSTAYACLIN
jgi:hypothetical protein